ncbi:hypothetical protein [Pseudomaricurvus sp. HS19]|uniref:hypothetical protein n=1 Tax=Pseudomaricurvus sp. HS19 TaxID=2692626 RepID=UPI0013707249|nr:hypothetical protein [Pseudomaricurvus sp. HS19]MYM62495.1 hypothetical protein [Pseudomaricurvus sp. HS19]
MNTNLLKLISSLAMLCLAASLAYLSYAILTLVRDLPAVMESLQQTSAQIEPVVEQADSITRLIPEILREVELVREQIPPILDEVKATREAVPPLLAEWQSTRTETIPQVLQESAAIRGELPAILRESEGYRALVPDVLTETGNIRASLPVTLTRLEGIVDEAKTIASSAGENAVTGLVTGIFKAPFQLMSGVGRTLFPASMELSKEDYQLVENKAAAMLAQSSVNDRQVYYNDDRSLKIVMEVEREFNKGAKLCRELAIQLTKNGKNDSSQKIGACLTADGRWTLE